MPEARLQRTRDAYRKPNQYASVYDRARDVYIASTLLRQAAPVTTVPRETLCLCSVCRTLKPNGDTNQKP